MMLLQTFGCVLSVMLRCVVAQLCVTTLCTFASENSALGAKLVDRDVHRIGRLVVVFICSRKVATGVNELSVFARVM